MPTLWALADVDRQRSDVPRVQAADEWMASSEEFLSYVPVAVPNLGRQVDEAEVDKEPETTEQFMVSGGPSSASAAWGSGDATEAKAQHRGSQGVEELICSYPWPQGCGYWIGIARCESSLSPDAVGYMGSYVGLFQVWLGHGYEYTWLLNPSNNVLAAWELSREGRYTGAWPAC